MKIFRIFHSLSLLLDHVCLSPTFSLARVLSLPCFFCFLKVSIEVVRMREVLLNLIWNYFKKFTIENSFWKTLLFFSHTHTLSRTLSPPLSLFSLSLFHSLGKFLLTDFVEGIIMRNRRVFASKTVILRVALSCIEMGGR